MITVKKFRRSPLLHSASGFLVFLGWSLCFWFTHSFLLVFFCCCFSFIVRHAALHGTRPRTRSPLPPHPSQPHHPPLLHMIIPPPPFRTDSWADGRVRSTRSMGGAAHAPSKLLLPDLPPGIGQARGLSAGTHPSPDQPTTPPSPVPLPRHSGSSDLSHGIK